MKVFDVFMYNIVIMNRFNIKLKVLLKAILTLYDFFVRKKYLLINLCYTVTQ